MDSLPNISWLGHASFSFIDTKSNQRIYYVDPFDLHQTDLEKADILFITHAHPDHLSLPDIKILLKDTSIVVAPKDCLDRLSLSPGQKQEVTPLQSYIIEKFSFQTVPAYNINPERLQAHPQANNWVGYIFDLNGKQMYHAGDTDFIPEMKSLTNLHLDVAMLPIGGTYTMDVDEAIEAANTIAAQVTIPMHYKRLLGDKAAATEAKFKQGVTKSQVMILPQLR